MKITGRARQMELFWWLPATCRALQRRRRWVCAPCAITPAAQLCLELKVSYLDDGEEDDPLISAPMIHRTVSAASAEPLPIRAGGFVFDLAGLSLSSASRTPQAQAPLTRVERTDGVVRCVRILPQDTAEWQDRERIRRAKQIPPKPTRQAKTMSDKMRGMLSPG